MLNETVDLAEEQLRHERERLTVRVVEASRERSKGKAVADKNEPLLDLEEDQNGSEYQQGRLQDLREFVGVSLDHSNEIPDQDSKDQDQDRKDTKRETLEHEWLTDNNSVHCGVSRSQSDQEEGRGQKNKSDQGEEKEQEEDEVQDQKGDYQGDDQLPDVMGDINIGTFLGEENESVKLLFYSVKLSFHMIERAISQERRGRAKVTYLYSFLRGIARA